MSQPVNHLYTETPQGWRSYHFEKLSKEQASIVAKEFSSQAFEKKVTCIAYNIGLYASFIPMLMTVAAVALFISGVFTLSLLALYEAKDIQIPVKVAWQATIIMAGWLTINFVGKSCSVWSEGFAYASKCWKYGQHLQNQAKKAAERVKSFSSSGAVKV